MVNRPDPDNNMALYTALAIIGVILFGALIWAASDTDVTRQAAQNQTEQSDNTATKNQ
jgi:hypothetical protein